MIFRYTGGVPRLINTLCDTAMMAAFDQERDSVMLTDIQAAIAELQWSEFSSRTSRVPMRQFRIHAANTSERACRLRAFWWGTEAKTVDERELRPGRKIIGRTPDNDIQIDSKFVSRHHCQIITTSDSCVIEDLNSTNGIYVKSKRVRKHNFNDGDVVVVGQHEIMYMDERVPRLRGGAEHPDTQALNEDATS